MARKILLEGNYQLNPGVSGVGNVFIGKVFPWERLVLITNVTQGKVIYNFSDPSLRATNVVNLQDGGLNATVTGISTTGSAVTFTAANSFVAGMFVNIQGITPVSFNGFYRVTAANATSFTVASTVTGTYVSGGFATNNECNIVYLNRNTTSMTSNDEIQITFDEYDERFKPSEESMDSVGKLRTSAPQSLIDTDFEYGRQDSKWESVGLINNRPFAVTPNYNGIPVTDIQTSTAGSKTITVSLTNGSVATTATGVQGNGTYALYTTASAHNLAVGQFVTVAGVTPAGYNTTSGIPTQILAIPSTTTFIASNSTTGQSTVAGTVTSNVAPPIGTPIAVTDAFAPHVSGNYVVETRPGETSFTFSAKGSTPSGWASTTVFDPNKTLVSFGFYYAQSSLIASSLTNSGQAVTVTTTTPHGLSLGNEIAVVGATATTNAPNGNFVVSTVTSPTVFTYYANSTPTGTITANITATTASGALGSNLITVASAANIVVGMTVSAAGLPAGTFITNIQGTVVTLSQCATAALSGTTTTFYTSIFSRHQGTVAHRAFDGGVLFSSNAGSNNSSLIRQTRRYFHYQSGKGVQMSSGTILKPTYGIDSLTYSAPFVTVQTKEKHGLQPGYQVTIYGANESGYNGTFAVVAVTGLTTFTYAPILAPAIATASGNFYASISSWNGAVARLGIYDSQNGVFFEYDGTTLWAVRRSSIFQIAGRVSVTNGSNTISQTSPNYPTIFSKQLVPGDNIVLRGQSYRVTDITSDTSITVQPAYRGISATNVIVSKTIDTKVPQSQWNLDPVNGGGPSEYNLDLTRSQMFYIDYSWYGSGAIRWGVRATSHGNIIYVNKMANNGVNATAYMRSGNLPGRYEASTIPATTTITASVGSGDTTINVANTYGMYAPTLVNTTATGNSGQYTITVNSNAGIALGQFANATNITAGTVVTGISGQVITLSATNAGAVSGAITFQSYPGSATIRSGSTYETINYTGITSNTLTGVTRGQAGSASLALTIAAGSNVATVGSATGLQVGQRIVSPAFPDGTKIEYIQGTTLVLSQSPTTANPTVIAPPMAATSGQAFTYSSTAPIVVEQAFPTFSPALSHWGTSVVMDGLYTPDKNLLFTYGQTSQTFLAPAGGTTATGTTSGSSTTVTLSTANTNIVPGMFLVDSGTAVPRGTYVVSVTSSTIIVVSQAVTLSSTALTFFGATSKALFSIRVSPSVDNGTAGAFGAREVLNRMQLILNTLDVSLIGSTTGNILVQAYLNATPYNPTGTSSVAWTNVVQNRAATPNSSLAQIADFSTMGTTGSQMLIQGGEVSGGFFTNSTGTQDISQVRDLGNSILGGGTGYANTGVYPDGPDTLTFVVTNVATTAQPVLGRVSWTEAQA